MFQLKSNYVTVFVDDAETPFVSVVADRKERVVTYKYCIRSAPSARIRVTFDTDGVRLQAVFKCRQQSMCIVNAAQRPLVFDGFIDAEDESRTNAFVITNLNALRPDHGLRVREMARAMESPTILQIFVNEAIFEDESHLASRKDDDDTAELQLLMNRLKTTTEEEKDDKRLAYLRRHTNTSRWAPVSCKTGKHLLTIKLKFLFTNL
jgi:hypothetical protein